jgi:mediator of RNA polymerase II transcription subunit 12
MRKSTSIVFVVLHTNCLFRIRLAAYFHAEHLLDREHYMDWLVTSLETCPQAKLPLWILITQIYWKDLMQYRKYGRRLSAALMNHFEEVYQNTF